MFCNACGKEVAAGATACAACGQPQPITIVATPAGSRVSQHGRLLGMLWVAYAILIAFVACAVLVVANTVILHVAQREGAPTFLHPLISAVGFAILVKAALAFAAGYGLLQRASWGRVTALIMGFLSLFNMPFGTALGIYTLWVLLAKDGEREYERYVGEAA